MSDVVGAFGRLCGLDVSVLDALGVRDWLVCVSSVRALLDAIEASCVQRLTDLTAISGGAPAVEQSLRDVARVSKRDASTLVARANTLADTPQLQAALEAGEVTAAHVDVVSRATKQMGDDSPALTALDDWLTNAASTSTPERFEQDVKRKVRDLQSDGGLSVFERQRRAAFLRHWTDRETGMVCLRGEFDPESGSRLIGRLDAAVERLFHAATPDTCPSGSDREPHLRALALLDLTAGSGSGVGRSEISIVIDYETMLNGVHERSLISNDHDIELCVETIRRIACESFIYPVVLDGDSVILDLGRGKRLASSHQRRALRAVYRHCGWPGCSVLVKDTKPHHIDPWAAGGATDLDDLVPLCARHHHAVHEGGWRVERDANTRNYRYISPNGEVLTTGPPNPRSP